MNLGEINKGAIVLILVLLLGGGGYLWYSQMYKPAVAERETAKASEQAAVTSLTQAKADLAAAQERIESSKSEASKADDSLSRLAISLAAVPRKKLVDDAAIVLMDMADQSGIRTGFKAAEDGGDAAAASTSTGPTPIDLKFEAAGTYAEMMQFMSLVEGNVQARDGKLYAKGRLFNVVKLEIGEESEDASGSGGGLGTESESDTAPALGPNDISFTVVVRMYTTSNDTAQSLGDATADPAAAATTTDAAATGTATDSGAAGATSTGTGAADATAGAATSTDGAAAGATGEAGAGAGATSTTASTDTAGAPA